MELIFEILSGTFIGLAIVVVLICLLGMTTVENDEHQKILESLYSIAWKTHLIITILAIVVFLLK